MTLPYPTVTHCRHCSKVLRDERSTPKGKYSVRYEECATCRAKLEALKNEFRTGVENPLVKTARPPSLPSSTAAASPVPDLVLAEAAFQAYMGTNYKGERRWDGYPVPLDSEDTHADERKAWINAARAVRDALQPNTDRDGIFLADDDGDSLVFDVRLVMTARTRVEDGARISTGRTDLICGGTKPVAWLEGVIGGEPRIYGQLAEELVKAIEAEIAARQPRKGDEP